MKSLCVQRNKGSDDKSNDNSLPYEKLDTSIVSDMPILSSMFLLCVYDGRHDFLI